MVLFVKFALQYRFKIKFQDFSVKKFYGLKNKALSIGRALGFRLFCRIGANGCGQNREAKPQVWLHSG